MKWIAVIALISIFSVSNAADYTVKICELQTHTTSNNALLKPCANENGEYWQSKIPNCSANIWVGWDMNLNQGQSMYSTALAAFMANKPIKLRIEDGYLCTGNYDSTSMIRIMK